MTIVTRFPPSPTGFMHLGNARTALFNWLYARHTGGKFLVRIEDTDRKRHSEEAVAAIFRGLEWLGLDRDNEIVPSQYECRDRHIAVAKELLAAGKAYYCYCSEEELTQMREDAKAQSRPVSYDRCWRDRDPSEAPEGIAPVIRIKAPIEGASTLTDLVQGEITVENRNLDDFIILRSDGSPTYMLSVVVDDHDMGVTHVIRGDDHLNNIFRQRVLSDAMGWNLPAYAHLPLIHGPDGGKLSKRHGAQSLEDLQDLGYLPEAVFNYLLRLGWSHGDDEIISRQQAIDWFDVADVNKAPARFDFDKLDSLNAHYIREANAARLVDLICARYEVHPTPEQKSRILAGIDDLRDRASRIPQLAEEAYFYVKPLPFDYTDKAKKALSDDTAPDALKGLRAIFETLEPFTGEAIEQACRDLADTSFDGKLGKVAMPLRAALTGTHISPPIFAAAAYMGRKEALQRIDAAG